MSERTRTSPAFAKTMGSLAWARSGSKRKKPPKNKIIADRTAALFITLPLCQIPVCAISNGYGMNHKQGAGQTLKMSYLLIYQLFISCLSNRFKGRCL
jgi:hypothetical protein